MSGTPTSLAPAIPRPSAQRAVTTADRMAWAAPVSWVLCGLALLAYALGPLVGRSSVFGVVLAALAVAISGPVLARLGRRFEGVEMAGIMRLALAAKLITTLPRFEAREDSVDYYRVGARLADSFRHFDFTVDTGREIPGTGTVRYLAGIVEVFTFEDEFATFLFFSLLGFVGLVAFVLACGVAIPSVDIRRYALLVLFWPSLLYWPSSLGKESIAILSLGVAAYGAAMLLKGRAAGVATAALGLLGIGMVRPHVALIVVTALIVALIVRAPGRGAMATFARLSLISMLLVGGSVASDAVESLLDIDGLNPSGLSAALDMVNNRSAQGGSHFAAARIDGLSEYPWGLVTVLFRPFPGEASSLPMVVTSVEAIVLAGLLVAAIPRMIAALRTIRNEAYVAYAVAFTAVFVYLFSALGNFGILARQRAMTMPLVLVLVALPTAKERVRKRRLQETST